MLEFSDRHNPLIAAGLRAGGPPRPSVVGTPIIADVPLGDSPAHVVALLCLAMSQDLALVTTHRIRDALYARRILDMIGCRDTAVATPDDREQFDTETLGRILNGRAEEAVRTLCGSAPAWRPVRWVGIGSPVLLNQILGSAPELSQRLVVTQVDTLFSRFPREASRIVNLMDLQIVLAETGGERTIAPRDLAATCNDPCAAIIGNHAHSAPSSATPVIAAAASLRMPVVTVGRRRTTITESGQVIVAPAEGRQVTLGQDDPTISYLPQETRRVTCRIDPYFETWLTKQLNRLPTNNHTK
ncbi:hypothetical protein [Nocardia carnea]|uniref:hypothetical protein n=1 Tax=Nocardia carnea TaxID=37328 RepID=UPI002457FD75|nr:hypothetical protein [Nocardia carnea]